MNDIELEEHIKDCAWLWQRAYDRFQAHGDPHARDEALLWLHEQNQAILSRSPAAQAARHAEFERQLDDGVCFFGSPASVALGQLARVPA